MRNLILIDAKEDRKKGRKAHKAENQTRMTYFAHSLIRKLRNPRPGRLKVLAKRTVEVQNIVDECIAQTVQGNS